MRVDYGETLSKNPNIIVKSYRSYLPTALDSSYTTIVTAIGQPANYVQQHATMGFAFTF
jgi:hypothetical protein